MIKYITTESVADFHKRLNLLVIIDPGFMIRIGVHYGLFLNTVMNQGTPEQVSFWLGKGAATFGIIGCFGMTELGHGSNVAGVETIATFDRESDEFVIHTPTLTATKWWIGGAAESATHCVVFANLMIDNKNHGVKPFVVQMRDPQTFSTFPGVNIGDLGAKMGRNGIDNGWIQFTSVRVPRTNMLMRYTKVGRDGTVTEPPMAQLAYGALVGGRTTMIQESADFAKKALTIAIRYAVVRRQFGGGKDGAESKIMDFGTHKMRLLPQLATTIAMHFAAVEVTKIYGKLMEELTMLKSAKPSPKLLSLIDQLKETHATSAGLKAFCSWKALDIIEGCRQACGGQGYSSYSGLASLYQDFCVQCTWEGDNTVMTLQLGRFLVSSYRDKVQKNKQLPDGIGYLNALPGNLKTVCPKNADPTNFKIIAEAMDVTCANAVTVAGEEFSRLIASGCKEDEAYEKSAIHRFNAAKLHCVNYIYRKFLAALDNAPAGLKPILGQLCLMYGLHTVTEQAGWFLQFGYYQPNHLSAIQARVLKLLDEIRPQAIPLTDAFNFSDYVINSPLGCADGDVYRRIFEKTVQRNPPKPHAYFERVLKPVFLREERVPEVIELNLAAK